VDWAEPILEEPCQVKKGFVQPIERPGIGITWDEKAVKRLEI
jgi:L-alanine-DL-glutamate epimerase-like enolase superfamily enzyme